MTVEAPLPGVQAHLANHHSLECPGARFLQLLLAAQELQGVQVVRVVRAGPEVHLSMSFAHPGHREGHDLPNHPAAAILLVGLEHTHRVQPLRPFHL